MRNTQGGEAGDEKVEAGIEYGGEHLEVCDCWTEYRFAVDQKLRSHPDSTKIIEVLLEITSKGGASTPKSTSSKQSFVIAQRI